MSNLFEGFNIEPEKIITLISEQAPLLSALTNLDEKLISAAVKILTLFFKGELDIPSILPSLIPAALSYFLSLKADAANKTAPENSIGSGNEANAQTGYTDLNENPFFENDAGGFSSFDVYLQNFNPS